MCLISKSLAYDGGVFSSSSGSSVDNRRAITPRLTIFVSFDGGACFHAVYLYTNKLRELHGKTLNLPGFRQFYAKMQTKSEGQNNNGGVNGNGNGNFMWNGGGELEEEEELEELKEFLK